MNSLKLLSLSLNGFSCLLLIIVYILARTTVEKTPANKYFISVCISIFLFSLADIGAALSKGPGPLWHQPALYVSEFLYYLFIPVIVVFFFKYEKEYFGKEYGVKLDPTKPTLVVIGGSLGARTINEAMIQGIPAMQKAGINVIWQTGKTYFERCHAAYEEAEDFNKRIYDFLSE